MSKLRLTKNKIFLQLITFVMITDFPYSNFAMADSHYISNYKLAARSRWSTYGNNPKHQLDERWIDGFIYATNEIERKIGEYLKRGSIEDPKFHEKILDVIDKVNEELREWGERSGYSISIIKPDKEIPTIKLPRKYERIEKSGNVIVVPYLIFRFGNENQDPKERIVLFNLEPEGLNEEGRKEIGIKTKRDLDWLKVPGTKKLWIADEMLAKREQGLIEAESGYNGLLTRGNRDSDFTRSFPLNESQLKLFLDRVEQREHELDVEYNSLKWKLYCGDSAICLDPLDAKLAELRKSEDDFEFVKQHMSNLSQIRDPLLRRRLVLNYFKYLQTRIDRYHSVYELRNRLESRRGYLHGLPSRPKTDIRNESDRAKRRKVTEYYTLLGENMERDVIRLIKLHNKKAREEGFKNYPEYMFKVNEVDAEKLFKIFDEIINATEGSYNSLVREGRAYLGVEELDVWDWPYFLEQGISLPREYFPQDKALYYLFEVIRSFGVEPEELGIEFHILDQPYTAACTVAVDIPTDMRVLMRPGSGLKWYSTFFHEAGHVLLVKFNEENLILQTESPPFHEAMATLFESILFDRKFLRDYLSIPIAEVDRFLENSFKLLTYDLRRFIASFIFEYEAYLNPDQDLRALADKVNSKYLKLPPHNSPLWASDTFRYADPVYIQNYVLAWVITAQTRQHLEEEFGGFIGMPEAFRHIRKHYFSPGGSAPWHEKVRIATGEDILPSGILTMLHSIKQVHTQKAIDLIETAKAIEAKHPDTSYVVAIDKDIGPKDTDDEVISRIHRDMLFGVIRELEKLGGREGFKSLIVLSGDGHSLREKISQKIASGEVLQNNVVIIANEQTIREGYFDNIKGKAIITSVDTSNLKALNHVPLPEIINLALKIAFQRDFNKVRVLYNRITGIDLTEEEYQAICGNRIIKLILPKAETYDYDDLKSIYDYTKEALLIAA